jgi:[acyl-carrier-protein] S-malonyltransferase
VGRSNLAVAVIRCGVIFPGQGSQVVGMGADIAGQSPEARDIFQRASEILGYDLLELQSVGPEDVLRETQFSQPAIFATNVALYRAVGESFAPVVSAGHSFGELCSLTVAESLTLEDALRIVDARGKAMQAAADITPGGMSAVLGLNVDVVRRVTEETQRATGLRVQLANFNAPSQIVISGDLAGVRAAGEAMLKAGAKRVVPLNVSGAWHSELMRPAVAPFAAAVNAGKFVRPKFDVVSNVDALVYASTDVIKENLARSITQDVRWHDAAEQVLSHGLDMVIEFGASPVLGPLMKRMPKAPDVLSVSDFDGVRKLQAILNQAVTA